MFNFADGNTPKKVIADDIYQALKDDFRFVEAEGCIRFNLRDFDIVVEQNNVVGNILEEWLAKWFVSKGFEHIHNAKQASPDFWLDKDNLNDGWLEVKSFTGSPNFDVGAFRSYINEIIEHPWKLHAKYLLIKYRMEKGGLVIIEDFWLKNVWEICCTSGSWALKVQCKRGVITNIRPATWYSNKADYPTFECMEDFLAALEQTIYRYHDTNYMADHWSEKLCASYKRYYKRDLTIPRWMDIKNKYIAIKQES